MKAPTIGLSITLPLRYREIKKTIETKYPTYSYRKLLMSTLDKLYEKIKKEESTIPDILE